MNKPLINNHYQLQKFAGKGGWTYTLIPEIAPDKKTPFGWVKVRGSIDDYQIKNYHLMPFGNGQLFLPVKAEIRKKIGKQRGDWVHVILFADNTQLQIPEELLLCLQDEPQAYKTFLSFPEGEQKACIDWIFSTKKEETKVERIAETINRLINEKKWRTKEKVDE